MFKPVYYVRELTFVPLERNAMEHQWSWLFPARNESWKNHFAKCKLHGAVPQAKFPLSSTTDSTSMVSSHVFFTQWDISLSGHLFHVSLIGLQVAGADSPSQQQDMFADLCQVSEAGQWMSVVPVDTPGIPGVSQILHQDLWPRGPGHVCSRAIALCIRSGPVTTSTWNLAMAPTLDILGHSSLLKRGKKVPRNDNKCPEKVHMSA